MTGPVPQKSLENDLGGGTQRSLTHKAAEDPKLGGAADAAEGRAAIQRDAGGTEKRLDGNLKDCSKGKCKVLPLGRSNPRHQGA